MQTEAGSVAVAAMVFHHESQSLEASWCHTGRLITDAPSTMAVSISWWAHTKLSLCQRTEMPAKRVGMCHTDFAAAQLEVVDPLWGWLYPLVSRLVLQRSDASAGQQQMRQRHNHLRTAQRLSMGSAW